MGALKRPRPMPTKSAPALSGLLAGLLVLFALVAASPSTHDALHCCGDSGPGDCVACLLLHGQVAAAETSVAAVSESPTLAHVQSLPTSWFGYPDRLQPPGRGPPVLLVRS